MHREFEMFFSAIPFYGLAVTCIDHPVARDMIERLGMRANSRRLLTYGEHADADLRLTRVEIKGRMTTFDVVLSQRVKGGAREIKGLTVPIPGHHNALNALAAFAVASEVGLSDGQIISGMAHFAGVKRRFQPTGTWNGIAIFDDYGHHPVEIAAVLKAARAGTSGRVIAICEPHRYTRLRDLFDEFASCFRDADAVVVGPLYPAGETPIAGIGSAELASAITRQSKRPAEAVATPQDLVPAIKRLAKSGDTVMCFGAGQSTEWAHALPGWLAESEGKS